MGKKQLLSLNVSIGSYQALLQEMIALGKQKTGGYVCFANVHMTIECFNNKKLRKSVNEACIVTADGVPIAKAISWIYKINQDRVAGMDIMPDIISECESQQLSVFLFGSTEDILQKIKTKAKTRYPNLKIAGSLSPPFADFTEEQNNVFIEKINSSNADLVLVCLGCPKQEIWMNEHYSNINAGLLGLGAAFSIFAEVSKRAPGWMQKNGLEWLWRLSQNPLRLFKRYLITNTMFLVKILPIIVKARIK